MDSLIELRRTHADLEADMSSKLADVSILALYFSRMKLSAKVFLAYETSLT